MHHKNNNQKRDRMKKKIFYIAAGVVTIVIIGVIALGYGIMQDSRIKAAQSINQLEPGLYTLTYEGDYGFDEYLAQGGGASDAIMAQYITTFLTNGLASAPAPDTTSNYGCSTFVLHGTSGKLMGRNFDFDTATRAMIVRTKPSNGYASVSTACIDFIGMPSEWQPDGDMISRISALASIYLPLDGINEKGLCIADLISGDNEETHQATDKPDLTITAAIRLILDKAATVDEAIELLTQYDINSSIGTSHHFAIADSTGKSVVVEYIDNKMYVTNTRTVTNHYLTQGDKCGIGNEFSHQRFDMINHVCDSISDQYDVETAMNILSQASYQDYTQWSIVFDMDARKAHYVWNRQYTDSLHTFSILQ